MRNHQHTPSKQEMSINTTQAHTGEHGLPDWRLVQQDSWTHGYLSLGVLECDLGGHCMAGH